MQASFLIQPSARSAEFFEKNLSKYLMQPWKLHDNGRRLSPRPFRLTIECAMSSSPRVPFQAWTAQFDRWFAVPGSVFMKGEVNAVFFETQFEGMRHSHCSPLPQAGLDQVVALTWGSPRNERS